MLRILLLIQIFSFNNGLKCAVLKPDVEKKEFRFIINADPQIGPKGTQKNSLSIRNELLDKFVAEVNEENQTNPIDFVVYNGDLVNNPIQKSFDNFTNTVKNQNVPSVLVHGNHDGHDDDPKFFAAQKTLSGYEKLNYTFEYGDWYFVVIGAQQKYKSKAKKQAQLKWMNQKLEQAKDKQVILFMHYHLMPVGLSQMEYYTYWPIKFKNQILDLITKYGNVKYVFSGHVHTGVKASIKSSLEYKGVKFINSPTPAKARPFGEEFNEFEASKDRYFRTGFYLDVRVKGSEVHLFGRKIGHNHQVKYPSEFVKFDTDQDIRFFKSEAGINGNEQLLNSGFEKNFSHWHKSFRYQKDEENSFYNDVKNGKNILTLRSPWGGWSQDEYMESFQVVELDLYKKTKLNYQFKTPNYSKGGSGGYIKLTFFDSNPETNNMVLFHWGSREKNVKTMHKAWFYNMYGSRPRQTGKRISQLINDKKLFSFSLAFDQSGTQNLEVDLTHLISLMNTKPPQQKFSKISISHGVWTRTSNNENVLISSLEVDNISLEQTDVDEDKPIKLNGRIINLSEADTISPYLGDVK